MSQTREKARETHQMPSVVFLLSYDLNAKSDVFSTL